MIGISNFKKGVGTRNLPLVEKIAAAPIIPKVLNIFEPITFPIATPAWPLFTAINDAAISGKDVPIAIIVRPINVSGTPRIEEILTAEYTTASAEMINKIIPKKIKKIDFLSEKMLFTSIFSFLVLSFFEI